MWCHTKKEYALKMSNIAEDLFPNRIHSSQTEITEWKKKGKIWQDRPENSASAHASECLLPYYTQQQCWAWDLEHICLNTHLMDNLNIQITSICQSFSSLIQRLVDMTVKMLHLGFSHYSYSQFMYFFINQYSLHIF